MRTEWWIGVHPTFHGKSVGPALLDAVEDHVKKTGGRLLVVETSASDALQRARSFYKRRGYLNCGCIRDFYGQNYTLEEDAINLTRVINKLFQGSVISNDCKSIVARKEFNRVRTLPNN
jgi:ribosomal protein S18 acetylase RimI-like enzyme